MASQTNPVAQLPSLEEMLACPLDKTSLSKKNGQWVSAAGRVYPEIQGIPILFHPDACDTLRAMGRTRALAGQDEPEPHDPWYVDTLGLDEHQKEPLLEALRSGGQEVDPVVSQMIAATCGNLYVDVIGNLRRYPIPNFRLKDGNGRVLVDIGCNWGRWCLAAAREGFIPIGVDPQIGALLAAKRVADQLGVKAHFICADARHLPLRPGVADVVFSYSVIQHLSRSDVAKVIEGADHALKLGGELFAQMPNVMGPRCFYQWARRGFNDGSGFNVRYWTLGQLRRAFQIIGPVDFEIDCFFGIGLQPTDADIIPLKWGRLLAASEALRALGRMFPPLSHIADSVYVKARKTPSGEVTQ